MLMGLISKFKYIVIQYRFDDIKEDFMQMTYGFNIESIQVIPVSLLQRETMLQRNRRVHFGMMVYPCYRI